MSVRQWILPQIQCAGSLVVECRIQKSRTPQTDNLIGIWDATVSYSINDVVYVSGTAYPGWRSLQNTNVNNAPSEGVYWTRASDFEYIQPDLAEVFYLDQVLFQKSGLGPIQRNVSRQQGQITPDSRSLKLFDHSFYSGHDGNGIVTPVTQLGNSDARTLINLIFDDPNAIYTIFFARVTGSAYDDRALYYIGDIDYTKATADYTFDGLPGTIFALQKLAPQLQADAAANRLNTFTVQDLVQTITVSDMVGSQAYPFIGNYLTIGTAKDIPNGTFRPVYNVVPLPYFKESPNNTVNFYPAGFDQDIIPATSSINDGLHMILLQTVLQKISALINDTYNDPHSYMSFWVDYIDRSTGICLSKSVGVQNVGFCYELMFGVDPRCNFGVAEIGIQSAFTWNTPLADVVRKIAQLLITYLKTDYDQTNFRTNLTLYDSIKPTGNPLPSEWEAGEKAGMRPRLIAGKHVTTFNTGDSDRMACPTPRGASLDIEIGPRVKKLKNFNTAIGEVEIDLIYNSNKPQNAQGSCWRPMSGGTGYGGHVTSTGTVAGPLTPPIGYAPGDYWSLADTAREFVTVQGKFASDPDQLFFNQNDKYGDLRGYVQQSNGSGYADVICIWNGSGCSYGSLELKINRNSIHFVTPTAPDFIPQNPGTISTGSNYYVIGYTGLALDLVVTDGSDLVTSATYDFNNFDAVGNPILGQQIIIPARGVFTAKSVNVGGDVHKLQLDRAIVGSGTDLEIRIGGPSINPDAFILGSYLYYQDNALLRFEVTGKVITDTDDYSGTRNSFFPVPYLGASGAAPNSLYGCYTVSRMRYVDGVVYDGGSAPDDTYGNSLKSPAQCHALLNIGSRSTVNRPFRGINSGPTDYNLLDTYTEHAQGINRTYRATGLQITEYTGTALGELLEQTSQPPLNDKNFPVIIIGQGSSGSGGSSGGAIGSGGNGGGSGTSTAAINLTISSDENDYALVPLGMDYIYFIDVTGNYTLSGLAGGSNNMRIKIFNIGTGQLQITSLDSNSTSTNQFALASVIYLQQYVGVSFAYSATLSKWIQG